MSSSSLERKRRPGIQHKTRRRRNIEPTAALRWIPERTRCAHAFDDDGSSTTKAVPGGRLAERELPGVKQKEFSDMAAQKGKDLLLKVDTTGAGVYVTVAGLRARNLSISAETVEITNTESAGQWRELLTGAGVKSARVTGSGVFKDGASDATIRDYAFNGTIRDWQIIVPDFGTIQGAFQITALEFSGRHDAEVTFDISLESAGELTFVAA